MTTPHEHAAILIAIAEGKKIQWERSPGEWEPHSPWEILLNFLPLYSPRRFRIAPETIVVNGVECPKPLRYVDPHRQFVPPYLRITIEGAEVATYEFATRKDARTVYDALCKPFKEGV